MLVYIQLFIYLSLNIRVNRKMSNISTLDFDSGSLIKIHREGNNNLRQTELQTKPKRVFLKLLSAYPGMNRDGPLRDKRADSAHVVFH